MSLYLLLWLGINQQKSAQESIRYRDIDLNIIYIQEEKHFNLQSVELTFLSFFQYKAHILAFFTSCKM